MKRQYLYLIVILVILVIAALGWNYYSSTAQFSMTPNCPRWKCTATVSYTCPSTPFPGYLPYSYIANILSCKQTLWMYFTCPSGSTPSCSASGGSGGGALNCLNKVKYTCPLGYSPSSCAANILSCTQTWWMYFICPSGYTPSYSGSTLTCTGQTSYICGGSQPFSWCTSAGGCTGACPV